MANIIQINGYTISSSNGGGGGSDFPYTGSAIISGSLIVTGSTTSTLGFTGSLFGTSSWATNALSSSIALSLRTGSSTIIGDTGVLNISTPRLFLTGSISTEIAGNNGINLIGSVTSNGNIVGGNVTNNVSSYTLGTIGQHWNNIFASTITFASSSLLSTVSLYTRNSNIGINTQSPSSTLDVSGSGNYTNGLTVTGSFTVITGSNTELRVTNTGVNIGNVITDTHNVTGSFNVSGSVFSTTLTSSLRTNPGTTTIAPIVIASGSNLTTPASGAIEYDGTVIYSTNDASSQRGYVPSTQIFRLTGTGGSITTIANFFGANSAIQLAAGGVYEIEAYCYFSKITANGTVTVTITTSAAPVNLNGIVQFGLLTNGGLSGTANQIALFNSTAASSAFAASGTLTTSQNHAFIIRLIVEANASASNLRINFTSNAGGLTPLRGSYYKVTKLPSGNVGNFVA